MQQTVLCPKCGAQNAAGQGFCAACGAPLQLNCPNCNSMVDAAARFCFCCGARLGWGLRFKDIQSQLTQAENGLRGLITQNTNDIQSQLIRTEDGMKTILGQYYDTTHAQQILITDTAQHIAGLIAEEHSMSLARKILRIGSGIIALGLAGVGISYVIGNDAIIALAGIIVVTIGFLLQLISNFITAKPKWVDRT